MIKLIYEGKKYNYEGIGRQPYDINTQIDLVEDPSLTDLIEAMLRIAEIATYRIDKGTVMNAVENIFENF